MKEVAASVNQKFSLPEFSITVVPILLNLISV